MFAKIKDMVIRFGKALYSKLVDVNDKSVGLNMALFVTMLFILISVFAPTVSLILFVIANILFITVYLFNLDTRITDKKAKHFMYVRLIVAAIFFLLGSIPVAIFTLACGIVVGLIRLCRSYNSPETVFEC